MAGRSLYSPDSNKLTLSPHDRHQFFLLIMLYFLQGIPVGLTFGTIPFILKSSEKPSSYLTIGIFSMATYPYSFKILWSPLVDSFYWPKVGRRRSWIIPVQLVTGITLYVVGSMIGKGLILPKNADDLDIKHLTTVFLFFVIMCSTQDIAVDGWALNILSKESLSYASTAQTIGLNIGYFMSFSIFLSLSSDEFMQKYFKTNALFGLPSYLKFSGLLYVLVTIYVIFATKEDILPQDQVLIKKDDDEKAIETIELQDTLSDQQHTLLNVYKLFWKVIKLPSVQTLAIVHMVSKIAFQCNDAATRLKFLEKGLKKEDLAITVLINFPFELIFGFVVAKWSNPGVRYQNKFLRAVTGDADVLTPWVIGYLGRIVAAAMGSLVVYMFPEDESKIGPLLFLLIILQNLLSSFMSTFQFVSMAAFHTRIADPVIGGTYMTLLNTVSNWGGTWPRIIILSMIDRLSEYECTELPFSTDKPPMAFEKNQCLELGGKLITIRDGYYLTNAICILLGIVIFYAYLKPTVIKLHQMPSQNWRVLK